MIELLIFRLTALFSNLLAYVRDVRVAQKIKSRLVRRKIFKLCENRM